MILIRAFAVRSDDDDHHIVLLANVSWNYDIFLNCGCTARSAGMETYLSGKTSSTLL